MSKNQKTYILLFAVVLIWGAVGFQIYRHYEPDPPIAIQKTQKFTPIKVSQQVSYTITPDYRDPFTGKLYKKPKPKAQTKIVKPAIQFPAISYNGIISGENKTFIVTINGTQEIFKLKDVIKGFELVKGDEKQITLRFKGELKKYNILR